ncbi:MAG: TRAP transporter small permease subunit [Alphaproteobacteria bacterium]|nr:TRAP transporter small permease subunit [Alphaproteobacteria bacterium]MCW5741213.1 TRAP transporter small permease subunit [Alphaproteobacteria bacterium]
MQALLKLSRVVDLVNENVGRAISWLVLAAVLVSSVNAVIRKVFSTSSNAWLELQWYLFSAIFMLCAAYALIKNEHIRIDIVSSRLTQRGRDWIDILGHVVFLLPLCVVMVIEAWPYFHLSFVGWEQSSNAGGLLRWPVKLLIVVGFAMLGLQGVSELVKRIAFMRGAGPDPYGPKSGPH